METLLHTFLHTLLDTLKALPFLFGVYLLIEFLEHKASDKLEGALRRLGPFGPVGGAALGCVPQCGFGVVASNLYSGRIISLGTLLAVFISTSDEAIPLLLTAPDAGKEILRLIVAKLAVAVIAGLLVDSIMRFFSKKTNNEQEPYHDLCEGCGCEHHSIFYSAIKHTVQIFLFMLAVSFLFGLAIELVGEEALGKLMMTDSIFQPLIAALVGLIPNCAPSVILTELYIQGTLSFGSVVAGLSTGAGMGLVVLFRTNKNLKQNLTILALLYTVSAAAGLVVELIM